MMVEVCVVLAIGTIIAFLLIFNKALHMVKKRYLLMAFIGGAVFAAISAIYLERMIDPFVDGLWYAALCVPIIEEGVKALAIGPFAGSRRRSYREGVIFGAVVGMGFVLTENMIYGMRYADTAIVVLISIIMFRLLATTMMHIVCSSISGYAWVSSRKGRWSVVVSILLFGIAVGMHAMFNICVELSGFFSMIMVAIILVVAFSLRLWFDGWFGSEEKKGQPEIS